MLLCILFFQLGWSLFYQYVPWMLDAVSASARFVAVTMAAIGLGMCLAFCVLAGALQKRLSETRIAQAATGLLALFTVILSGALLNGNVVLLLTANFAAALVYGCGYTSLVANAVSREQPEHVGRVLGTVAAVAAITAAVTAFFGGALAALGWFWIPVVSAVCFVACFLILTLSGGQHVERTDNGL